MNHGKLKLTFIIKYIVVIFFSLDKVVRNIPIKLYSFYLFYNVLSWKRGPQYSIGTSEKTGGEKQRPEIHLYNCIRRLTSVEKYCILFFKKKTKQINNKFK